jgi:hypothetical protein
VLREPSSGEEGGEEEEESEESEEDSDGDGAADAGAAGVPRPGAAAHELPSEEDDDEGGDGAAPSQYELLARRKREAGAGTRRVRSAAFVCKCAKNADATARPRPCSGARKRARLASALGDGTAAELDRLLAATGRRRNSRSAARRRKTRAKTGAAMVRAVSLSCAQPATRWLTYPLLAA